jgi:hypothetical protein
MASPPITAAFARAGARTGRPHRAWRRRDLLRPCSNSWPSGPATHPADVALADVDASRSQGAEVHPVCWSGPADGATWKWRRSRTGLAPVAVPMMGERAVSCPGPRPTASPRSLLQKYPHAAAASAPIPAVGQERSADTQNSLPRDRRAPHAPPPAADRRSFAAEFEHPPTVPAGPEDVLVRSKCIWFDRPCSGCGRSGSGNRSSLGDQRDAVPRVVGHLPRSTRDQNRARTRVVCMKQSRAALREPPICRLPRAAARPRHEVDNARCPGNCQYWVVGMPRADPKFWPVTV